MPARLYLRCFGIWRMSKGELASNRLFATMGEISITMLCITWDAAAVPEGGSHIAGSPAAFAKAVGKEPAGKIFHEYAMRQAGHYGTPLFAAMLPSHIETS